MCDCFDDAFDAALEIVTATVSGETEVELSAEGAAKVMEYFEGIYDGMCEFMDECCDYDECDDCDCDCDDCECDCDCECDDEEENCCAPKRSGKFEIKHTDAGYSFNLKAANGEVIATSEVYTTKAACIKGIESVIVNAAYAEIVEE